MSDDEVYAFLEHHGVKGMKWGVRNEDEVEGNKSSPVQKALKANPSPKLSAEQKRQRAINEKKHDAKFDGSEAEPSKKGWRPTKKQVVLIGVGAVVAGGIIAGTAYKIKSGQKLPSTGSFSEEHYLKAVRSSKTPGWVSSFAGTKMDSNDYRGLVDNSKDRVWMGTHITKESFTQPGHEFPKGHTFFRLSRVPEKSFNDVTYATSNVQDFSRYVHSLESIGSPHEIMFKSTDVVKIPNAKQTLDAMHRVMVKNGETNIKPKDVVERYNDISGSPFLSPLAKKFKEELFADGFSGVIDFMDAGVLGEAPITLLDKSKFGPKTVKALFDPDIKKYAEILTDIPNRR